MPAIDLDGMKIYYATKGNGSRNIVFLHGMNCSRHNWGKAIGALSDEYRVFAPNLNRSGQPREGYTPPAVADAISGFVEALALGKVTLVGHSFGGLTALYFALLHPDQLDQLVLVSTGATLKGHNILTEDTLPRIRKTPRTREFVESLVGSFFYRKPPEPEFRLYIDDAMQNRKKYMVQAIAFALGVDLTDELKHVKAKTLVVYGLMDPLVKLEHAQSLNNGIASSRLALIEEAGHLPMVEQPDLFNTALLDFLAQRD